MLAKPATETVVIASAQPLFLDGLATVLDREFGARIIARCTDVASFRAHVTKQRPDLAIIDTDLSRPEHVGVAAALREVASATALIVFSPGLNPDVLLAAVRAGVRGVLLKSVGTADIAACIRVVRAGGYWLEKQMSAAALRAFIQRESAQMRPSSVLTPRETEIAMLVRDGLNTAAIGARLGITAATVKFHLSQIYRKLGVEGRVELMAHARTQARI
jgi:DNA-binding NarL/FixJ family response regulator